MEVENKNSLVKLVESLADTTTVRKFWAAFLIFGFIAVISLRANPFAGETSAPLDLMVNYPGWETIESGVNTLHSAHSDTIDNQYPNWIHYKKEIWEGRFPYWNMGFSGGSVGALSIVNEFFSPFFWPFLVIKDDGWGLYVGYLLKLMTAGIGLYLFLSVFLNWPAAVFGGVVFMLCGFHASWFYVTAVSVSVFIPWLLWATANFILRDNPRSLIWAGVSAVFMICGGFPSVAAYGFYAFSLFALVACLVSKSSIKNKILKFVAVHIPVMLSFVITALPLMVLYYQLGDIDMGYRNQVRSALSPAHLIFMLNPYINGLNVELTFFVGSIPIVFSALLAFGLLWRIVGKIRHRNSVFSSESSEARTIEIFSLLLLTLSLGITFGIINPELVRHIPVFSFNPWTRLGVIVDLALAITAGMFVHWLFQKFSNGRPLLILSTVCLLLLGAQVNEEGNIFRKINSVAKSEWFYPPTPTTTFIKQNLLPLQSVIADQSYIISGSMSGYGIAEWFAHEFKSEAVKKLLTEVVHDPFRTPTSAMFPGTHVKLSSEYFRPLGIRYVAVARGYESILLDRLRRDGLEGKWSVRRVEKGISIFEHNDPIKGAYFVSDLKANPADINSSSQLKTMMHSHNEIEIEFVEKVKGWVVLPVRTSVDWKASVNGLPVNLEKYLNVLPAIPVDGPTNIVYEYAPSYLKSGIFVSSFGLIIFLLLSIALSLKKVPLKFMGVEKHIL